MSDQAILIQAFEHAVTMAHDVTRPLYHYMSPCNGPPKLRPMPLRSVNIHRS
jgi:hypothetical protein